MFYFCLFFSLSLFGIDTYHLNINELYLETHVRGQPHPTVEWFEIIFDNNKTSTEACLIYLFLFRIRFKDSVGISRTDPKYQVFNHPDGLCELIVNFPNSGDR